MTSSSTKPGLEIWDLPPGEERNRAFEEYVKTLPDQLTVKDIFEADRFAGSYSAQFEEGTHGISVLRALVNSDYDIGAPEHIRDEKLKDIQTRILFWKREEEQLGCEIKDDRLSFTNGSVDIGKIQELDTRGAILAKEATAYLAQFGHSQRVSSLRNSELDDETARERGY